MQFTWQTFAEFWPDSVHWLLFCLETLQVNFQYNLFYLTNWAPVIFQAVRFVHDNMFVVDTAFAALGSQWKGSECFVSCLLLFNGKITLYFT